MQNKFEFYETAIRQTIPNVYRISLPTIRGNKDNVLFAQTTYGAHYTFKFNGFDSAMRNSSVSHALINAKIPVPDIHVFQCDGQWFEGYPTLRGDTLYECVGHGATKTELESIYHQAVYYLGQMSQIDYSNIDFGNLKYAHQSARNDTANTNGAIIGNLTAMFVGIMNIGMPASYGLYHHGMTPKNILVSPKGIITGLLDIDEVSVCNKNYAFGVLAAKATLIGMNINALCSKYESITGQKLNHRQISAIVAIQNMGRNILHKTKSK
ncbi:MAG: hypothetical protein K2M34_04295 [Alphaproteobacteria bacterium]|nr:hypothetical protein [Alphaproteobacteria bacterium]